VKVIEGRKVEAPTTDEECQDQQKRTHSGQGSQKLG
jgi:hypothetical protein